MKVQDKIEVNNNHSIEWGEATWTKDKPQKDKSIRNRYANSEGRFNYAGSSEVPWDDFILMIVESIERKHFSLEETQDIFSSILNFLLTNSTPKQARCRLLKMARDNYQRGLDSVEREMRELGC